MQRREHASRGQVRVVRDHERVATGSGVEAGLSELPPEQRRGGRVDEARRKIRHDRVPEDHVAVQVVPRPGRARPFVADQGGEAALRAAVVRGLRSFDDLAPGTSRGLPAALTPRAAELEARRRLHLVAARGAVVHREEREARVLAVDPTDPRVVTVEPGRAADVSLAEHLGVVGHGREVERTRELELAQRFPVAIVGLHADPLAAREAVRVGGTVPRALRARVEREHRVHVQVAEERSSQRVAVGADARWIASRFAGLVGSERRARERDCDHRDRDGPSQSLAIAANASSSLGMSEPSG